MQLNQLLGGQRKTRISPPLVIAELHLVYIGNPEENHAFYADLMAEGRKRVQADIDKLQAMGLMDSEGNSLSGELPEDMRDGSGRDEGD